MLFFWRIAIAGRDAVDAIDVRLLHPLEELPGVGRQRLDVAPLPFGVNRVEGERRLSRSADAGDDDQLAERQRQVDVLEVVRARAVERRDRRLRTLRMAGLGFQTSDHGSRLRPTAVSHDYSFVDQTIHRWRGRTRNAEVGHFNLDSFSSSRSDIATQQGNRTWPHTRTRLLARSKDAAKELHAGC